MTSLAKIISYLFHPLLMPGYGILLLFYYDPNLLLFVNEKLKSMIVLLTFVFTFFLPALNAFVLFKLGYISSLQMDKREERRLPYLITCIFYLAEYYLLSGIPLMLKILILGAAVSVFLTFFINSFWKISAHMVGIGGMTGAFVMLATRWHLTEVVICLFLVSGLVGFARLHLNKHKPSEAFAGYLMGFFLHIFLLSGFFLQDY